MSFNHPVSDLVTRIRNGCLANRATISAPVSKLREAILHLLKEEGFILSYSKVKEEGKIVDSRSLNNMIDSYLKNKKD
jgi:small subunit ribosomal protein S8